MTRKEEINARLAQIENEVKILREDVDEYADEFDNILDDDGDITICGVDFSRSRILKECDPVAYRTALLDYMDALRDEDLHGFEELNDEKSELEDELEDLEEEEE